MPKKKIAPRKRTVKKKTKRAPRKDFAQVALAVVEKSIGGKLAG
jgi:hypothetical protein